MPLFLSLLLLLLGNPARANYGWSGSVSIQGADPAPLQEHPTVAIEEELLHLAVGNSDHEPVAQWSVLYRFRNHGDESVHVEGVFPVELLLGDRKSVV